MRDESVNIIGAGVAGLTVAAELIEHGYNVSLYDKGTHIGACLLYTSPSPRDLSTSRMPSSA